MKFCERVVWQADDGRITIKFAPYGFSSYEKADRIGKKLGLGKAISIELYRSRTIFERIREAVGDFKGGVYWKLEDNPPLHLCCILHYCLDTILDKQHTAYRWRNGIDHVPCWIHLRKMGGRENL